jgi:surface carbohydrate biosynthesis protein
MKADFVYIEVENFQRDLKWRLNFASVLVQKDYTVLIGRVDQTEKFANRAKFRGLYLLKDGAHTRLDFIKKLSKKNKIVVLDEESFSCCLMPEKHLYFRVSEEVLNAVDFFLCSFYEEYMFLVRNNINNKDKIILTGNPRFKYSNISKNNKIIRKILVPFSYYFSPLVGEVQRHKQIETMKRCLPSWAHERFLRTYDQLAAANARLLQETVMLASRFPEHQFVLRPHPSCAHDFSKYVTSNVSLSKKLTIDEDIIDADLVLHTNCTSGVDALSNGVRAVNLFTNMYTFSNDFPNMKGLMGPTLDELPLDLFGSTTIENIKRSGEIPVDPLKKIFKIISNEVSNSDKKSIYFRPKLTDMCKLPFREDRLVATVRKMLAREFRIKLLQNQVLQLEK